MPKLDHVALEVSDMNRAIRFYTEKLGLNLLFREVDEKHAEEFAFLELESGNIELLRSLANPNPPRGPESLRPPLCPHVAIQTTDMEALVERLRREDVPIVRGPLEIPGRVRWLYVHDPDYNVIEFVRWL